MDTNQKDAEELQKAAEAGIVPGAIVNLKSGGPQMTVENVDVYTYSVQAKCSWFDGNKQQTELFKPVALKVVAED